MVSEVSRTSGRRRAIALAICALSSAAGCGHAPRQQPAVSSTVRSARHAPVPVFVSPSSYQGFIRGELHAARGQHGRAVSAYRAAIELGDPDPYLLAKLAEELERAGRADEARELLASGLARHPDSEALALAQARSARRRGDEERALASYARAEQLARSSDSALERIDYLRELGHRERAIAALRSLSGRDRGGAREHLRVELELTLLEPDARALAQNARDWLALGGGDAQLTRRAAAALLAMDQPALALELLATVPPSEDDARARLEATLALGRTAQSEHLLSTLPPHWLGGPLAMAEAYLAAGLPERALRALSERASAEEDPMTAARRRALVAQSLSKAGRAHEAAALLNGDREATCETLRASGLSALARDAGCEPPNQ